MAAPGASSSSGTSAAPRRAVLTDPGHQAFVSPRTGFTAAPALFGLDKFADLLVDWPAYLAPWINDLVPGSGQSAVYAWESSRSWPASWRRPRRASGAG